MKKAIYTSVALAINTTCTEGSPIEDFFRSLKATPGWIAMKNGWNGYLYLLYDSY